MATATDFGTFDDSERGGLKKPYEETAVEPSGKKYPVPLTLPWRIFHFLCYLNGGVTFFLGSICLYPSINYAVTSAILYTLGSVTFLMADTLEWLTNNHVGCFWYQDFEKSYEESVNGIFEPADTSVGQWQRAEVGINFFLSATGSFLYLLGSAAFLPSINAPVSGLYLFMIASAIIMIAQAWKVYRGGLGPAESVSSNSDSITTALRARVDDSAWTQRRINWTFNRKNYDADIPGFYVDFLVIFGAAGYFVGSPFLLPQYDTSDSMTSACATFYTLGGLFFTLSGLAMFHRYFFTQNYPH